MKKLYGNTYLDPNSPATPDNQNAILEEFPHLVSTETGETYCLLPNDCTNAEFHAACVNASKPAPNEF